MTAIETDFTILSRRQAAPSNEGKLSLFIALQFRKSI
jgi:hypothetical protein